MQPAAIDPTLDLCTRYPLRLGGHRQYGIHSLPDTSTDGQHWELNPRPSDLESNALSTRPHAPSCTGTKSIITSMNEVLATNAQCTVSNHGIIIRICLLHHGFL